MKDPKTEKVVVVIKDMSPVLQYLKDHPEIITLDFKAFGIIQGLDALAKYHADFKKVGKDLQMTFKDTRTATAYKEALNKALAA